MTLATGLMGGGILLIIVSFFIKDGTKKVQQDVEELSISIYQETNGLKKRLKIIEEELFLEPKFTMPSAPAAKAAPKPQEPAIQPDNIQRALAFAKHAANKANQQAAKQAYGTNHSGDDKPIHDILKNQVLALHKQGLSISEISQRSTLSEAQVQQVIMASGGA